MQNKGFVIFISTLLAIICAYYMSFSPVVRHYDKQATKITAAGGDGKAYLDSMANEKVWFGYTLKNARKQQIGLGLDLKGGMNVVLRLDGTELLRNLSGHSDDPLFLKALDRTKSSAGSSFIDRFVSEYKKENPQGKLALLFDRGPLKDQISSTTSDEEVIKILRARYSAAMDASLKVLRTRIDRFGVVSPNLQRIEGQDRILVELPGVKEPERVRELLQRSANLQFWRTYTFDDVRQDLETADRRLAALSEGIQEPEEETATQTETTDGTQEAQAETATPNTEADSSSTDQASETDAATSEQEKTTATESKTDAKSTTTRLFDLLSPGSRGGAVVGIAKAANLSKIDSLITLARENRYIREDLYLMWGYSPLKDPQTGKETDLYELYAIRGNRANMPDLRGDVVTSAKSEVRNDIGQNMPMVTMSMNEEGSRQWARITKENIGKAIAVVLDGVVYSAPNVSSEITGGNSQISGSFTLEETTDLANVLNSGKMETSIVIEQESVVGPSLGQESIRAGIISFIIAIILLAIYMCLYYGLIPGLLVDSALIINSFFTVGVMASFHSVLTLSGIAGLVLSLGMAVDANVLIFERIKEELRAGKSMARAIKDGYGNAFSAIFDSNLTTIITGGVLFFFGTGPIKGFATTLIIGLVSSFITAVFLTRIWAEWLEKKGKLEKVSYTTRLTRNFLTNPKVNFLGKRKVGMAIPVVFITIGMIALLLPSWGLKNGIEFSGGRNYVIEFDQPISTEQARQSLSNLLEGQVLVTSIGTEGTSIRVSTNYKIEKDSEAVEQEVNAKLYEGLKGFYKTSVDQDQFVSDKIVNSQRVSPSMSKDIRNQAVIAVVIAMIFMALYILIRFRDYAFSLGAFAAVLCTTLSLVSFYTLLWKVMPFTMEVDQNFIAALLAIIGYSINDVVVVFDRVREYKKLYPGRDRFTMMNDALSSTLSRTINTGLTSFLVMIIVFILGGASMRSFTFSIIIGILVGTYHTLFVAAPITYVLAERIDKRKSTKKEARK